MIDRLTIAQAILAYFQKKVDKGEFDHVIFQEGGMVSYQGFIDSYEVADAILVAVKKRDGGP